MTDKKLPAVVEFRNKGREIWCVQCDDAVERWSLETPIAPRASNSGIVEMEHTGEKILTVECHGEKWRVSNRRGRLD